MSGIKITGNTEPVVGKQELYTINGVLGNVMQQNFLTPKKSDNPFENMTKWSVHVLENGKWRKTEGNDKTGETAPYTFNQKSLERKGIKLVAERGDEHTSIIITPQKAEVAEITKVEILDAQGKAPTKPFAYGQTLIARTHCVHMELRPVTVTLWEDDATGAGHNTINNKNKIQTKTNSVFKGIVDIPFLLTPDAAKIANAIKAKGDSSEGKTHEYYVTAEIYAKKPKKIASTNVMANNPDYTVESKKPTKPAPAEKKGKSKKEEKGIGETIIDGIHDWFEETVNISPITLPSPTDIINSVMKIFQPDENEGEKGICVCKENNFYWSDKLTCDERKKVLEVCADIWGEDKKKDKASELMSIMHLETIKTFSPSKKGVSASGTKFIGLIQFSATTAKSIGTTYEALGKMTFIEQMKYVKEYLTQNKDKMNTIVDFYLQVIKPSDVGMGNKPDHAVFDESVSVPDGDGRNTSKEQRDKNITREPWVTKYGYASNPTFMNEKDEKIKRTKWVYTRQRYEERYGTIGGKTTIKEIDDVLRNEHYKPGAIQLFKGKCDNVVEEEKSKNSDNERAPWMKLAWIEEAKNLIETGENKEIQKFFEGTPYEKSMKDGITNERDVAWCAAFINWIMTKYGYKGITGYDAVRALKWANWDGGKDLGKPVYGAIAVKTRNGGGHVGFVAGKQGNKIIILGGNQSQKLHCVPYNVSDYFAYLVPSDYSISDQDYSLPDYDGNPGEVGSEA